MSKRSRVVVVAFNDEPHPYTVPLSYGFEINDDGLILYFHGAAEGHKADLMAKNPHIKKLTQILRGWRNYFKLDTRKGYFEKLDINIGTHLRVLIWRAWKKPKTRERELRKRGFDALNAWKSANNGRGPWHNAQALHMRIAIPNVLFTRLGLFSLSSMGIV